MKELKAPDKVAQKMTHDGAVQENLATGEVTNISSREAEADFSPSEEPAAAAGHVAAAHGRHKAKKAAKAEADTIREGSAARQRPSSRLQFTEEETCRYLRTCGSRLKGREVYHMTGGWPGCVAMLVRLSSQLDDRWTVWELCSRYEIRQYIGTQILSALPAEEVALLKERAPFPRLEEKLEMLLWNDSRRDEEDRLCARGAMVFVPEKKCWYVHPALRIAIDDRAPEDLCRRAVEWYETKGYIQDALTCSRQSENRMLYRDCLLRNYDKVSFLNYEKVWSEDDLQVPGFLYLEWMENFLRQDQGRLRMLRIYAEPLWKEAQAERKKEIREILLNMAYADPDISTEEWMEMLEKYTGDGQRIRLYHILGESVSFLSGLRELSAMFACGDEKEEHYRRLWTDRLVPENQMAYRLARLEYSIVTDTLPGWNKLRSEALLPYEEDAPWQIRLGSMYIAWLLLDDSDMRGPAQRYIDGLVCTLRAEEVPACRWNARALYYLARAKCSEKEKLMEWLRDTGGDIGYDTGRTRFHIAAEVKISLYLGNYAHAEELLQVLVPWFEAGRSWKWLAESLFQRAITEKARGETGQALKTMTESIAVANPYRYVRIYCGYGVRGLELLEEYRGWLEKNRSGPRQGKKKYKYGNVLRMPVEDWLDYIVRKAGRQKKYYLDLQAEQQNIYRVEKLTVTELMVLQYMEKGFSNAEISAKMNVKLPTVKSHIYNIYKKLGVTTRIQAVQKAKESGIL